MEVGLLLLVLAFTLASFAFSWLPLDVTALTSLGLLLVFRLVTPEEAISGFSNPAVVTVMMMFVLSEALVESGVISRLGHRISRAAGESAPRATVLLLLLSGLVSSMINNTAAVAVFLPVAMVVAKHYRFSPSKVLLPLSYVSIAGGTCTLIGTSTNLLVSSLAAGHGLAPFSVFEFAPLGVLLFATVVLYSVLVLWRMLPARADGSSLTSKYHLGAYLTEVRVPAGSPLVGHTVLAKGISERFQLNVLEIIRGRRKISQDIRYTPLEADDLLLVRGGMEDIVGLKEHYGLLLLSDTKLEDSDIADESNVLAELQIAPQSRLAGQTLRQIDFRKRYGCFVLALNRLGKVMRDKVAFIQLEPWDIVLVFGPRTRIEGLQQQDDFLPLQELDVKLRLSKRWWIGAAIIPLVVVLAAFEVLPILTAAILGVVVLLLTRSLTVQKAYKSIDWTVIFLLAAILPLGLAVEKHGLAEILGNSIAAAGHPFGPLAGLGLVLAATLLLTEVISNNSAAVLMVPVALSTATHLGVDPKPLLMGVTYAASMSFMTPVGYQTNTMVYGPGGYRFTDYLRAGAPLTVLFWVLAMLFIPLLWPL